MMEEREGEKAEIIRLNKYLAHCGLCTRKEAVDIVKKGLVTVNGVTESNPFREMQESDAVTFRGKAVQPVKKYTYLLLNKPHNVPFSSAEEGEETLTVSRLLQRTAKEILQPAVPTLNTTSGLVVMTNDAELTHRLSDPAHRVKSVYLITLTAPLLDKDLVDIRTILTDAQGPLAGLDFPDAADKTKLGVELMAGTDSWLLSLFTERGYSVQRLDRTFYGGLTKKDLKRGWSRLLVEKEIVFLRFFH